MNPIPWTILWEARFRVARPIIGRARERGLAGQLWKHIAGGRVDSPPTIHDGMVLFGGADGRVTCLRVSDGELAWRFLAAPADTRGVAFGRLESPWPVHGSVLLLDGVAYCCAGRSTWLDGGMYLYGLDPVTGEVLRRSHIRSRHPPSSGTTWPPQFDASKMTGRAQLFIGDEGMLYSGGRSGPKLLPEEEFKDYPTPPETLPRSPGHYIEWIQACKGQGPPPGSNFLYSGWVTDSNHLGNVAYRTGKKLGWDHISLCARNAPEADQFIRRPYRKGWDGVLT